MSARYPRRVSGEETIFKRRQREGFLETNRKNVQNMMELNSRAEWEDKMHRDNKQSQIQKIFTVLQNQEQNELHERRVRLADLYNYEMAQWKQECLNNVETPEERKQAMIKRARELKERREAERLRVVQEKRMQQYRERCDDLRSIDSRRMTEQAMHERQSQITEKEQELLREQEYEKQMAIMWERERQKMIQREENDRRTALQRNQEVKSILDLQVDLYKQRTEHENKMKQQEDQEMLRRWAIQGKAQAEKDRRLKMQEITRAAEVKRFNRERATIQQEQSKQEQEYDMRLLELALQREAEAEAKEKALQEQFKKEQIEYQQMLRRQMEIEAEDLSYLDDIRRKMEEEVWEKRDAIHRAEAAGREALMQAVMQSREEEIKHKEEALKRQEEEDRVFMIKCAQEAEEALAKEQKEQEQRLLAAKQNQTNVLHQRSERRALNAREKQEEYLEFKRMQLTEKQHQQLVEQMSSQPTQQNHRRKTAEWYFNS